MRFVLDQQLPPDLGAWFRRRGHESEHVRDVGLRDAADGEIWTYASSHGAIIVSKDEDFASRRKGVNSGPQILWLRCGNVSNASLVALFEREWVAIQSELDGGASVIEVR
jgi:predicted nuclease of predicted toxin-antitoxin system